MVKNPVTVPPDADREAVAELIQRYGPCPPVVDDHGVLGIVAIDDVIEAVQRRASEANAAMVGAGIEETIYTSSGRSIRHRLP